MTSGRKNDLWTSQEAFLSESYLWSYRCDPIKTLPSCTTFLYYNLVNLRSMNSSRLSATTLPKCVKTRCANPLKVAFFWFFLKVVRGKKSMCRATDGFYVLILDVENPNNLTGMIPKKFVFAISGSRKRLLKGLKSTLTQHAGGAFFLKSFGAWISISDRWFVFYNS